VSKRRPVNAEALKETFEPLRTNHPRAGFSAAYRKESDKFGREYTRKYDEDLNTPLIFVSRLIIVLGTGIGSKLEPDLGGMVATLAPYMPSNL